MFQKQQEAEEWHDTEASCLLLPAGSGVCPYGVTSGSITPAVFWNKVKDRVSTLNLNSLVMAEERLHVTIQPVKQHKMETSVWRPSSILGTLQPMNAAFPEVTCG